MPMLTMGMIFSRLAAAALAGAVIGLERVFHRRPAGLRTSMFVCFGAALFTLLSGEVARQFGDTSGTRIVSNLIPGIGFLGAGAIIRERGSVTGLTTAATIFVLAAIGLALGAGLYTVGIFSVVLALFGLIVLAWLEDALHLRSRMVAFRVTADSAEPVVRKVHEALVHARVPSQRFQVSRKHDQSVIEFDADVNRFQEKEISAALAELPVQFVATPLEGSQE